MGKTECGFIQKNNKKCWRKDKCNRPFCPFVHENRNKNPQDEEVKRYIKPEQKKCWFPDTCKLQFCPYLHSDKRTVLRKITKVRSRKEIKKKVTRRRFFKSKRRKRTRR